MANACMDWLVNFSINVVYVKSLGMERMCAEKHYFRTGWALREQVTEMKRNLIERIGKIRTILNGKIIKIKF